MYSHDEDEKTTTEFGSTEVDLRDLLQPVDAYNRNSSPQATSLSLNVASPLHNSSPYLSIFGSPGGRVSNAFADRFVMVHQVPVSRPCSGHHLLIY